MTIEAIDQDLRAIRVRFDQAFRERGGMWIFANMDVGASAVENPAVWASAANTSVIAQFDAAMPDDVRKALTR